MKSPCPICDTDDYTARTLKEHFLLCHRERPVLVGLILDHLDQIAHLTALQRGTHYPISCVFCGKQAQIRHRRVELES
jgi:hypothetical protein